MILFVLWPFLRVDRRLLALLALIEFALEIAFLFLYGFDHLPQRWRLLEQGGGAVG